MKGSLGLQLAQISSAWCAYPRQSLERRRLPPGDPVFLTGATRSGTTWAARMLSVPGLWSLHEPFNPVHGLWPEEFSFRAAATPAPEIDALVSALLAGDHPERAWGVAGSHLLTPVRLLRPSPRRVLLKDPTACLLTEYLVARHGFRALVLFRHPCGFAASVRGLEWPSSSVLGKLLSCVPLMDAWLAPHASLMERGVTADPLVAAATLHGCLNRVLWSVVSRRPAALWRRYEDLCADPIGSFRDLHGELGLPYDDATRRRHEALCLEEPASRRDYAAHAVKRNSAAMRERWRERLTGPEMDAVRRVWEAFGLPLYEGAAW